MFTAPASRLKPLRLPPYAVTFLCLCLCVLVILSVGFGGPCHGKPLLLPVASHAPYYPDFGNIQEISIQNDQMLFLGAKWYPPQELPLVYRKVALAVRTHPDTRVVLSIDRTCAFSALRSVLRGLASHGIRTVTLRVERPEDAPLLPGA